MRALLVDLVRRGLGNVYGDVFIARSAFPHERSAEKFIHHIIVVCSNICLTFLPQDQILRKLLTAQYTQRIANNRKCFFSPECDVVGGMGEVSIQFMYILFLFCIFFQHFSAFLMFHSELLFIHLRMLRIAVEKP